MKIWKRAILYLTRKKGRSFLLIVLIFIMASLILVGNALRMSAQKEIKEIRKNLGSSFIVAADTENKALYEERTDQPYPYSVFIGSMITPQLVDDICNIEGVVDYDISLNETAWADLQLRPGSYANFMWYSEKYEDEVEIKRDLMSTQRVEAFICANGELNSNFRIGALSITEGRNILNDDEFVAVISEYIAEENNLTVGDTITLETKRGIYEPCDDPFERWGVPVELEVVGIFAVNFEQESSIYTWEFAYADNFIFIDSVAGFQLRENRGANQTQEKYEEVTFFVDEPEHLEDVVAQVKDSVDLNGLLFSLDDSAYMASVKPLKQISIFATILMIAGIFGCIMILWLTLSLWIRGRTREIGIYLSVGISKKKIICQMVLECIIITAIALTLTLILSKAVTNGCFNLAEKIATPKTSEETYSVDFAYASIIPTITKVSSGDSVNLESGNMGQNAMFLILVVCAISCGSVLLASIQVMKIPPNRLLQSG